MNRALTAAALALILGTLLASCSLLMQYKYEDSIRGNHVIVIMNDPEIEYGQYDRAAGIADQAYEEVVAETGLPFTATIVLSWSTSDTEVGGSAGSYAVRLSTVYLERDAAELRRIMRHEFTHVVVRAYFGPQGSICLSEGFAEYIADLKTPQLRDVSRHKIEDLLQVSYEKWYLLGRIPGFAASEAYDLAAEFVAFWCERYGLASFYDLYAEATTVNYRSTLAKHSGESFDAIRRAFLLW